MTTPAAATDNEVEWRALETMIGLASGFTLGFVVADVPALLDATVARLTETLGADAVATLALVAEDDDADLLDRIAAAATPKPARVVALCGVANLLDPHGERPSRALGRLNFNRTTLAEACPKPLVLLLPTWAMRELTHGAPDLWSWRSGMYRLGATGEEIAELVAGLPADDADRRARGEARRVLRHLVDEPWDESLALRALLRLGYVESLLDDYHAARTHYDRALTLARALGDRTLEADSLRGLADIARMHGDYDAARERYDRALTLARALGDRTLEARSLRRLADIDRMQGDDDTARERYDRALTLATTLGDRTLEADSLVGLAEIARVQGDYDAARERYDRALTLATTLGDRSREAAALLGLGRVAAAQREQAQARRHLRRAATIYRQLGQWDDEQYVTTLLATLEPGSPSG